MQEVNEEGRGLEGYHTLDQEDTCGEIGGRSYSAVLALALSRLVTANIEESAIAIRTKDGVAFVLNALRRHWLRCIPLTRTVLVRSHSSPLIVTTRCVEPKL